MRVVGWAPSPTHCIPEEKTDNACQSRILSLSFSGCQTLSQLVPFSFSILWTRRNCHACLQYGTWYLPTVAMPGERGGRKKGKGSQSLFTSSSLSLPPLCMCAQALIFCPELPDLPLRRALPPSNSYSSPPLFLSDCISVVAAVVRGIEIGHFIVSKFLALDNIAGRIV